MIMPCPECGALVDLRRSLTGSSVLLDPLPHKDGRWAHSDAESARFTGSAHGRYRNHTLTCR